jgi:hypothetical protein
VVLTSQREVDNTRKKLSRLEARVEALQQQKEGNIYVRDLTLMSLRRIINQLKEEIAVYYAHQPAGQA